MKPSLRSLNHQSLFLFLLYYCQRKQFSFRVVLNRFCCLIEADLADFDLEFLLVVADIPDGNVNQRQPGWLDILHTNNCL